MKRNCIPILVWLNILMLSTVGFCGCTPDSPTDTPAAACDDEDLSTYYRDGDGDSFGDSDDSVIQCAVSKGYVVAGGDCDDSDVATHPGAIETCDTIDNNCDGNVDEGLRVTYYLDDDGDGYGDSTQSLTACIAPSGYVLDSFDCNDNDAAVYPWAEEICDSVDNNCDGTVDEDLQVTYYLDDDGDGYGDSTQSLTACIAPSGYVFNSFDCNETDAAIHPGATETCDTIDNNCDGTVDGPWELQTWYIDLDGDGFGTESETACFPTESFVTWRGDCDDARADVHPGAEDSPSDGVDSDCGGTDAPEPRVGFPLSGGRTLKGALTQLRVGATLWIGPGTYREHGLEVLTGGTQLRSVAGADETILDAEALDRVMSIHGFGTTPVLLDGLTLTHGYLIDEHGAGLRIDTSWVELKDIRVYSNVSAGVYTSSGDYYESSSYTGPGGAGGGIYALSSTLNFDRLDVQQNEAGAGMGLWLEDCIVMGRDWRVQANLAGSSRYYYSHYYPASYDVSQSSTRYQEGGALALVRTQATLSLIDVNSNQGGYGAGIYLLESELVLEDAVVQSNVGLSNSEYKNASYYGSASTSSSASPAQGGGLHASLSMLTFDRVSWSQNQATEGAGLYLYETTAVFRQNTWTGNVSSLLRTYYDGDDYQHNERYASGKGGALLAADSSVTLLEAELSQNSANQGAGLYVEGGDLEVKGLRADRQYASGFISTVAGYYSESSTDYGVGYGGAVWIANATARLQGLELTQNLAGSGAGLFLQSSNVAVSESTFLGNEAVAMKDTTESSYYYSGSSQTFNGGKGAGIAAENGSQVTVASSTFSDNRANQGAGLYAHSSAVMLEHTRFIGNRVDPSITDTNDYGAECTYLGDLYAAGEGGSVYLRGSTATIRHTVIQNGSGIRGAGIALSGGSLQMIQTVLTGNVSEAVDLGDTHTKTCEDGVVVTETRWDAAGGGLYVAGDLSLINSIVAYNQGYNLWLEDTSSTPTLTDSDLYNPAIVGESLYGVSDAVMLELEPQFHSYADQATGEACTPGSSLTCVPDDLHLAATSPLVNMGGALVLDPDGSRSDIGSYGGPDGDGWDVDGDGYFDYFWPGEWTDAPSGFDAIDYDCDDFDVLVQACL